MLSWSSRHKVGRTDPDPKNHQEQRAISSGRILVPASNNSYAGCSAAVTRPRNVSSTQTLSWSGESQPTEPVPRFGKSKHRHAHSTSIAATEPADTSNPWITVGNTCKRSVRYAPKFVRLKKL